ncbi:MAG: prephenate dehydrogenase [Eubacterium sp.]|nr:prephenate dehydrogenase [Eubacterium sp.]MCM1217418.1 prephenate dehydrogenase [Lachnospiraceae bacterium]MCM1238612.1 prephenate dehydrogenase [Lachnospiraceae bacterium]
MSQLTCGFIGLGLIGGSIAKALKQSVPGVSIVAYDLNSKALDLALEQHVADVAAERIDNSFSRCDYIFLCAPVQKNDANLTAVKKVISPNCLLTDVGSVKTAIHTAVRQAGLEHCFIGGHPMAGSERTGFANSKASLLENIYYILTPTDQVPPEKLEAYRDLVEKMGAIPLVLDHKKHDHVTAAISHLPHVVASSLVNLVRDSDSADGIMKMVAAGGFKDITRIASSSAVMWQQICLTNTENISGLLGDYIDALTRIKATLDNRDQDGLYDFFDSARIYRDSFISASSGPIKRSFSISVDIADKAGALARIVTLLSEQKLSIKNIGITHNRETEDGVLQIEFYDESSLLAAVTLLEAEGYSPRIRQ